MRSILKIIVILCVSFVFVQTGAAQNRLVVFVSIVPQKYFVEQIGQDRVDVQVMVQPGASPATYEPKPTQMVALTKAKIYFSIGVPFENRWLKKIAASNPTMAVVPTDHGIRKLSMKSHSHKKDEHGSDKGHLHIDIILFKCIYKLAIKFRDLILRDNFTCKPELNRCRPAYTNHLSNPGGFHFRYVFLFRDFFVFYSIT